MKGKLKEAREILVAKICIFLLVIAGIIGVTYYLINKLFIIAIGVAILALIGIAIFWWIIFKTSKNLKEKESSLRNEAEDIKKKIIMKISSRIPEILGALLVIMLGILLILTGKIVVGTVYMLAIIGIIGLMIWFDTIGERKIADKRDAIRVERIKERFALKEGELVEVLFTPTNEGFTMRLSLGIQQEIETRYFALLEEGTISIVPVIGDKKLKPERMNDPETLEYQFTPIPKEDEDD